MDEHLENDDLLDDEFHYQQWLNSLEEQSERHDFFRIFQLSGTYPF